MEKWTSNGIRKKERRKLKKAVQNFISLSKDINKKVNRMRNSEWHASRLFVSTQQIPSLLVKKLLLSGPRFLSSRSSKKDRINSNKT